MASRNRRNRLLALTTAALAAFVAGSPAGANDSTAVLGAGGLELATTETISMDKEDLFISPSEVRVDYVFTNTSDKDVESIVAFPMPEIESYTESEVGIANRDSDNFMDFKVEQDGAPIEPQLQQRAIVADLDVTADLEEQGIPKYALTAKAEEAVKKLPEDVVNDWVARGMLMRSSWMEGDKEVTEIRPAWKLRSTYWWRTVFPAGKSVKVHHSYKPSVGGTVAMTFIQDGKPNDYFADYQKRYCLDDGFMKAAAKLEQAQKANPDTYYFEKWLSYILMTGNNWAGSIGDFHLTVDKEDPSAIVSFCGKDVTKTGPTTFEMRAKDFYPEHDLDVLIVYKQTVEQQ